MLRGRSETWGPQIFLEGAGVAHTRTGPDSIQYVQQAHTIHVHLATEPQWQIAVNSDRKIIGAVPLGALDIVTAKSDAFASWAAQKHSIRLDIDPTRLGRLAGAEFDGQAFELQSPKFGFVDKKAYMLALCLQRELENGDTCNLEMLDALVTIFSTYVLRNYSSLKRSSPQPAVRRLPPATWNRVRDFIEGNLGGTLTIEQLASVARLSPSHFNRSFKLTAGKSPHQFVIAARLAHARDCIVNTDTPLSLIAKSTGFTNRGHMAALMKRTLGVTPSEIRRDI